MHQPKQSSRLIIQGSDAHQIAQAIYYSVTGKIERISRNYSENYKIKFEDIKQLHTKCVQMCTQWKIIERNENITVYHIDDSKEVFSSALRFDIYDKSQNSPIESISYEFNALLELPNIEKPQPYKIKVRMASGAALSQKVRKEGAFSYIARLYRRGSINIDIEYVDYVVARNILSTIDSWRREIYFTKNNEIFVFIQRYSHWVPVISGLLVLITATFSAIFSAGIVLTEKVTGSLLAQFLILAIGFILLFYVIGRTIGRVSERYIDEIQQSSYILINTGDKKLFQDSKKQNKITIIKACISFVSLTLHAIFVGYIGSWIFYFLK